MTVGKLALAAALAAILFGAPAALAQGPNLSNATCLSCHGRPGFSTLLGNGQTRSLFVSATHFTGSVHGSFQCTTCHTDVIEIPHKAAPLPQAQWRQQAPKICGTCHTAELNDYSTSVHGHLVLWFKTFTLSFLPGFALNPATIVHGHECVLAAVYLFTIHFFVNHWRPDKFPLDIVIFTGSMPIEEFRREFPAEYARLTQTGRLDAYLVQAPSPPMRVGATILGSCLILVSLVLLVFIMVGGFLNI